MSKIQGNSNLNTIIPIAETLVQEQPKTNFPNTAKPTVGNNETDPLSNFTKTGTDLSSGEYRLARAEADNREVNSAVNRLVNPEYGPQDLTNELNGKSADYQAKLINGLIQKDPRRAAQLLGAAGESGNRVVAQALSNAYNAQGGNGASFLYGLIKNGNGASSSSVNLRAQGIANLIAQSGNSNMIKDFSEKSLIYAHQLRADGNPQKNLTATALTNGALTAASGNSSVLKGLINQGKINDGDITAAVQSGSNALAKALDTAGNGGFGTNFFLSIAAKSEQVSSGALKNSMVNYFNRMGAQLVNNLSAGQTGIGNGEKLANFFEKVVLPNADFTKSVFSPGGGFDKALKSALSRFQSDPRTAAAGVGRLIGALQKGLEGLNASGAQIDDLGNYLGDTIAGSIPFIVDLGPTGAKIGENIAKLIRGSQADTAAELSKELDKAFFGGIDQMAEELKKQGRLDEATRLLDVFKNRASTELNDFIRQTR